MKRMSVLVGVFISSMMVSAQDFDNSVINPFNLTTESARSSPFLADIDDDGDLDLFTGFVGGQFGFYENTGGASTPNFDNITITPFGLSNLTGDCAPLLADLDDDGDLDMFAGSDSGLRYFENQGNASSPAFGPPVFNPFGILSPSGNVQPCLADIDQDGDLDLFVGTSDGNLYYYTNTGTAGSAAFAAAQTNPFGLGNADIRSSPDLVDLDSDGDLDMVIGNQSGNFRYYENTGNVTAPSFTFISENPFNLSDVGQDAKPHFGDLDNDGDEDLISGNAIGEYYFFANTTPLGGLTDHLLQNSTYPNPFSTHTVIKMSGLPEQDVEFLVADVMGRIVFKKSDLLREETITFHRNGLSAGIYFAYLRHTNNYRLIGKLVIE